MFGLRQCDYVDNVELNTYLRQFFLSGNIISGSSSFSKSSVDLWKFLVRIMLKPGMQDFKHDLNSMGDECNCPMVSTFFSTTLFGNWDENRPCPVLWSLVGLRICCHTECSTLTASSFRV